MSLKIVLQLQILPLWISQVALPTKTRLVQIEQLLLYCLDCIAMRNDSVVSLLQKIVKKRVLAFI